MAEFFMMSIVFATVALPAAAARDSSPRRGMRRLLLSLLVFDALYVAYLTLVYVSWSSPPRLVP